MTVSIHQPNFLPWLGYFNKIASSDIFIILDSVQFSKGGYTNRNKIKYANSEAKWLAVPIDFAGSDSMLINELKISQRERFQRKHLETLKTNYSKAPFSNEVFSILKEVYEKDILFLADFNIELLTVILKYLEIDTKVVKSSELLAKNEALYKNNLLINLINTVGGSIYLSGTGAKDYNDEELYAANGIKIIYNEFTHPVYPQLYGDFISHLSIIDLLFNCGKESIKFIK